MVQEDAAMPFMVQTSPMQIMTEKGKAGARFHNETRC